MENNNSNIEQALNQFGEQVTQALKNNLNSSGKSSLGFTDSIQFNVLAGDNKFSFQLSLPDYYKWVNDGRKPGKFPPPQAIADWIQSKGIQLFNKSLPPAKGYRKLISVSTQNKSLAYLIGRKIGTKGIKPTNFYTSVISEDLLKQLSETLSNAFKQDSLNQLTSQ